MRKISPLFLQCDIKERKNCEELRLESIKMNNVLKLFYKNLAARSCLIVLLKRINQKLARITLCRSL